MKARIFVLFSFSSFDSPIASRNDNYSSEGGMWGFPPSRMGLVRQLFRLHLLQEYAHVCFSLATAAAANGLHADRTADRHGHHRRPDFVDGPGGDEGGAKSRAGPSALTTCDNSVSASNRIRGNTAIIRRPEPLTTAPPASPTTAARSFAPLSAGSRTRAGVIRSYRSLTPSRSGKGVRQSTPPPRR